MTFKIQVQAISRLDDKPMEEISVLHLHRHHIDPPPRS